MSIHTVHIKLILISIPHIFTAQLTFQSCWDHSNLH